MVKTCEICGRVYTGKTHQRFCSLGCKRKFDRMRYECVCVECGTAFRSGRKTTKYCSPTCQGLGHRTRYKSKCYWCGKEIDVIPSERKMFKRAFCGNECVHEWKRSTGQERIGVLRNPSGSIDANGYRIVYGGYKKQISEHRKVMEEYLGRPLRSDEIVHHIDHDKTNNDISNLEIVTRAEHMKMHRDEIDAWRAHQSKKNQIIDADG